MHLTRNRRSRAAHVSVARERGPAYRGGEVDAGGHGSSDGPVARPDAAAAALADLAEVGAADALADLDRLDAAVARLVEVDVDPMTDEDVRSVLVRAQRAIDRLLGLRSKLAGTLESRALRIAGPGREHQALRAVRDRTADELRLTPTEVKRSGETGRRLAEVPAAHRAMTDGDLPPDHARILADTLRHLDGTDRVRAERELLERARGEDARTFGRSCRRLLAELDTQAAQAAQDRRNARRHLRVAETPDGMLAIHGQGSGWDAEVVATALHAFARPVPDDRRDAEQRAWDALVTVCTTALDAGTAPENRGVRPHVLVTVPHPAVGEDAPPGPVETAWNGPMPWPEVRRHLVDAGVSRLLVDAAGLPLEASEAVRSVPVGLWRVLSVRDRSCVAEGCSVPNAWCQVMHLDRPYRFFGRLSPTNAAMGCSRHHRLFDRSGWVVTWLSGRPVLHHPDRQPPGHGVPATQAGPDPPNG
jgi:hypothetical protein